MSHHYRFRAVATALCSLALASGAFAAAVPVWLDDAISSFNGKNPATPITFVKIKDSFVWYQMPKTAELGAREARDRVNALVTAHGYQAMDEEGLITTARPPAQGDKKCWSRSFVLNIQSQNNTKAVGDESPGQRQRMLTTLVCDDATIAWAAFRVAQ